MVVVADPFLGSVPTMSYVYRRPWYVKVSVQYGIVLVVW